jgi:hypothetical protein
MKITFLIALVNLLYKQVKEANPFLIMFYISFFTRYTSS